MGGRRRDGGAVVEPTTTRRPRRALAELLGLTGIAVAQPVLEVFGDAPDLFIHRQATRFDIIAFAAVVSLAPALVLWAVELVAARFSEQAGRWVHVGFVGVLAVLFGLQFADELAVTSPVRVVGLALAAGAAAVFAYLRWTPVRLWVAYLAPAPVVFAVVFLTTSATAGLLDSQEVEAADLPPASDPTSVVLLQFDEWPLQTLIDRDGRIDADLYPNLARLAEDGTWFRNTSTVATWTSYAIPAIVTGRAPDGERSPIASEYPESLYAALGGQFELEAIETLTRLCPTNLCDRDLVDADGRPPPPAPEIRVPSGLDALLEDARLTYQAMLDPDPNATSPAATFDDALVVTDDGEETPLPLAPATLSLEAVDRFVTSIERGEEPTVHSLHLLLPHTPYRFLPDGTVYAEDSGGLAGPIPAAPVGRGPEQAALDLEEQRLLLQASYVDGLVGRVLDRLRETGLYDDAIVVVAADHGIGLEPGGAIRTPAGDLEPRNYPDLLYVPLIIKAPELGEPGTVSDENVSTVDIVPTLLGALGVEPPWSFDGIDLGRDRRSDPEKTAQVVRPAGGGAGGRTLDLGEQVTFDGDEVLAEVLRRNVDVLLRDDNPAHRLYDVHDAGELVGRSVDDLEVVGPSGAEAELARPEAYEDVDRSSGVLPTHFVADLDGVGDDPAVAVVLNGRVAAVIAPWPVDGTWHLEAMLVPELVRDGRNTVDLYLVSGTEGHRRLSPVEVAA